MIIGKVPDTMPDMNDFGLNLVDECTVLGLIVNNKVDMIEVNARQIINKISKQYRI
jgi:hypothetical protein